MKCFYIDASLAGVAGDMMLGALVDLSGDMEPLNRVCKTLEEITGTKVKVSAKEVHREGILATQIVVEGFEVKVESEDLIKITIEASKTLSISKKAEKFAESVIQDLLEAEKEVHGKEEEHQNSHKHPHLHELGTLDTCLDVLGTAVLCDEIGFFKDSSVFCSPIAVGSGYFESSHGKLPVPAPTTLEILTKYSLEIIGGPVEGELTTPTGIAILANLVENQSKIMPQMIVERVGHGAGSKKFPIANVLRIIEGEKTQKLLQETIMVLETNVDDLSGEILAHAAKQLMSKGALDVIIIPVVGKKSRPAQVVQVICYPKDAENLTETLMRETGTLGVRHIVCTRHICKREILEIDYEGEKIRVKLSRNNEDKIIQVKAEYEDCRKIAEKLQLPLRIVKKNVEEKARKTFGS